MKRARVLMVDDDKGYRASLHSLLRSYNFEIAGEAADGHAALVEAARLLPDVILMDLSMPRLSGAGVTALRACGPSVAIIVLTSHESAEYRQEALRRGADAFVVKDRAPFDLIPAIEGVLG